MKRIIATVLALAILFTAAAVFADSNTGVRVSLIRRADYFGDQTILKAFMNGDDPVTDARWEVCEKYVDGARVWNYVGHGPCLYVDLTEDAVRCGYRFRVPGGATSPVFVFRNVTYRPGETAPAEEETVPETAVEETVEDAVEETPEVPDETVTEEPEQTAGTDGVAEDQTPDAVTAEETPEELTDGDETEERVPETAEETAEDPGEQEGTETEEPQPESDGEEDVLFTFDTLEDKPEDQEELTAENGEAADLSEEESPETVIPEETAPETETAGIPEEAAEEAPVFTETPEDLKAMIDTADGALLLPEPRDDAEGGIVLDGNELVLVTALSREWAQLQTLSGDEVNYTGYVRKENIKLLPLRSPLPTPTTWVETESEGIKKDSNVREGETLYLCVDAGVYEGLVGIRWQCDYGESGNWQDIPGAEGNRYPIVVTAENIRYMFRVMLTVGN